MVDLNRGVTMRDTEEGVRVCMYKDDPGVFFDVNGDAIDPDVAEAAGFPVRRLLGERRKKLELEKRRREIEKELAEEEARLSDDIEAHGNVSRTFRISEERPGWFNVIDVQTGERQRPQSMSRSEAEELLVSLEGGADGG